MKTLIISLKMFLFLTILTGIAYPILVTGIAQVLFPAKANGSLIQQNNTTIGSLLIGQQFDSTIYFSSRPSAVFYNPMPSGGSNYGLTNKKLMVLVQDRKNKFVALNHLDSLANIPSEMLFASGSGLDPHISPRAALLQVKRIVKARNFDAVQKQKLVALIHKETEQPQFGVLGETRINVLLLNLELNRLK